MLKKTALAAGALALAAMAFQPGEAEAGNVGVYFGIGVPGFGYGAPAHYPGYYPAPRPRYRLSCGQARHIVRRHGYHRIRARDCRGKIYGFVARKHHRLYMVKVNARNGRIVGRYRI
ncbi:hypothetical protein HW532_05435 [Kaustia mangrovi]|uniref:Uncharacterized protein n=1 Tax=Kaustia mangrovi TaxID=2593653 RepID=A0A7S8C2K1_9HYPH|nr:hypothetical protein [Kaustia mangrovi]QPC42191.1 hypothetical protein HW532_05435 [Kaustia mangrovi]